MSEGHMRPLRVIPVSPDRFCPTCGRLLVQMTEGHTFSLSGKAEVRVVTTVDPENLPDDDVIEGFLEAVCNLRRCRFKRWLKREKAWPESTELERYTQ